MEFDEATGIWNVYGYPEAQHAFSDPTTFSSDTSRVVPDGDAFSEGDLVRMDPPQHTKLRKIISHAFSRKVVADLEPRIAEITHELLDEVERKATGRMEMVTDLAYPLPVIVIAELLGVPAQDRHLFKEWVDRMFEASQDISLKDPTEQQAASREEALEQVGHLVDYLREHAEDRRTSPRDDLLTKLIEAEVDGERLSLDEVTNFANVLLIAGHITTTMLMGNTVLCLDEHPNVCAATRSDRSMIPDVIEESLRFLSPFGVAARVTTTETELGGRTIPPDQLLMVWMAAANRDPRQFADPDVFDPTRQPNQHLGFGRGVHFCIGAPLARLEGKVALNILLDRFPRLRTAPEEQPVFFPNPQLTGVQKLPLLVH